MPPDRSHPIRILIVDDHPMMLIGIQEYLATQRQVSIVGTADTGERGLALARELHPAVVLLDIGLPDMSGLEATGAIRRELPDVKVIVLTMHEEKEYVLQFVRSGASGYVLKKSPPTELLQAIEAVAAGGAFFSPSVSRILLEEQRNKEALRSNTLTARERQILALIANGKSSKQIADALFLSVRTVSKHREVIMQKLSIHSVADLTRYAISSGLVDLESNLQ